MKDHDTPSGDVGGGHDELPQAGKSVPVEVNGCRCMAFRDEDGKWRDYFHGEELCGYIKVIQPN